MKASDFDLKVDIRQLPNGNRLRIIRVLTSTPLFGLEEQGRERATKDILG